MKKLLQGMIAVGMLFVWVLLVLAFLTEGHTEAEYLLRAIFGSVWVLVFMIEEKHYE